MSSEAPFAQHPHPYLDVPNEYFVTHDYLQNPAEVPETHGLEAIAVGERVLRLHGGISELLGKAEERLQAATSTDVHRLPDGRIHPEAQAAYALDILQANVAEVREQGDTARLQGAVETGLVLSTFMDAMTPPRRESNRSRLGQQLISMGCAQELAVANADLRGIVIRKTGVDTDWGTEDVFEPVWGKEAELRAIGLATGQAYSDKFEPIGRSLEPEEMEQLIKNASFSDVARTAALATMEDSNLDPSQVDVILTGLADKLCGFKRHMGEDMSVNELYAMVAKPLAEVIARSESEPAFNAATSRLIRARSAQDHQYRGNQEATLTLDELLVLDVAAQGTNSLIARALLTPQPNNAYGTNHEKDYARHAISMLSRDDTPPEYLERMGVGQAGDGSDTSPVLQAIEAIQAEKRQQLSDFKTRFEDATRKIYEADPQKGSNAVTSLNNFLELSSSPLVQASTLAGFLETGDIASFTGVIEALSSGNIDTAAKGNADALALTNFTRRKAILTEKYPQLAKGIHDHMLVNSDNPLAQHFEELFGESGLLSQIDPRHIEILDANYNMWSANGEGKVEIAKLLHDAFGPQGKFLDVDPRTQGIAFDWMVHKQRDPVATEKFITNLKTCFGVETGGLTGIKDGLIEVAFYDAIVAHGETEGLLEEHIKLIDSIFGEGGVLHEVDHPDIYRQVMTRENPQTFAEDLSKALSSESFRNFVLDPNGPAYQMRESLMRMIAMAEDPLQAAKTVGNIFEGSKPLWRMNLDIAKFTVGEFKDRAHFEGLAVNEVVFGLPTGQESDIQPQKWDELNLEDRRLVLSQAANESYSDQQLESMPKVRVSDLNEDMQSALVAYRLYETISLSRNEEAQAAATLRNSQLAALPGWPLRAGNLVHATASARALQAIMVNGALAGEFIGLASRPDSYPFNLDTVVMDPDPNKPFREQVQSLSNGYYGSICIVFNRGEGALRPGEEFMGGSVSGHRLMLGGLPTTEVGGIILRQVKEPELTASTINTVIQGNIYIPVYNEDGDLLLSYEQYQEAQEDMNFSAVKPLIIDSGFQRANSKGGSNEGAEFFLSNGRGPAEHYYVKFVDENPEHGWNEYLADQIYKAVDPTLVPETQMIVVEGRLARASRMAKVSEGAVTEAARNQGFVLDCLMGNWDAVFNGNNLVMSEGRALRIDNGNALDFRARGARKAENEFGEKVTELEWGISRDQLGVGMRSLYPGLTDQDIKEQSAVLGERLTDEVIDNLVNSVRRSSIDRAKLAHLLKARRDYIIAYAETLS